MDVLRAELARHALRQRAQAELGGRERRVALAAAQAAVAPVKKIEPRARGSITRAASRPVRKPARHAISQTLRNTRLVVSGIGKLTLAPTLKTHDFEGPELALDRLETPTHVGLVARIEREAARAPAARLDLRDQRRELLRVAAPTPVRSRLRRSASRSRRR